MKNYWYLLNLQLFAHEGTEGEGSQTGVEDAAAGQSSTENGDGDAEFDELISGKFKSQFTKKTQAIIDRRFKHTKSLEDYKNRMSPIINALMEKQGLAEGEEEKLLEGISNAVTPEASPTSPEEGKPNETQNNPTDISETQINRRVILENRLSGWVKEAQGLKEIYPDFDLRNELRSSKLFGSLIMGGAPLKAAFETVHRDELLSGAMAYTADKVRQQVVKGIEAKGRRPVENGVAGEGAVVTAIDVNSLTSKDILKILKQVENGQHISF